MYCAKQKKEIDLVYGPSRIGFLVLYLDYEYISVRLR